MRCVRNACLDNIRHQSIAMEYHERILNINKSSELDAEHYIFYSDLSKQLEAALNNLPEKYRTIFELNRLKGIKQKDIANNLNISVRTVEDRLSKALKALSIQLQDFRILFFL